MAPKKKTTPSAEMPKRVTRSSAANKRIRLVEGLTSDSDVRRKAKKAKKAKGKTDSREKKAKADDAPPKANDAAGGSGKGKEPDVNGAAEEDSDSDSDAEEDDGDDDDEEEPGGGKGMADIIMTWDIGLFNRKAEELKDCVGGAISDITLGMNPVKESYPDEQFDDLKLDGNCENRQGINWMTFHWCIRKEASVRCHACSSACSCPRS